MEITIDTTLGMITVVAQTSANKIASTGPIPNAVPDFRTVVTTTVVDDAPSP